MNSAQQEQDRADFEAWYLKARGHVNANSKIRQWLQEKDWQVWQAARQERPPTAESLAVLNELLRYAPGEYVDDPRSDDEIDAGKEAAFEAAKALVAKATGQPA